MTCGSSRRRSRSSPRTWPSTTWGRNAAWPTWPSPAPRRCWNSPVRCTAAPARSPRRSRRSCRRPETWRRPPPRGSRKDRGLTAPRRTATPSSTPGSAPSGPTTPWRAPQSPAPHGTRTAGSPKRFCHRPTRAAAHGRRRPRRPCGREASRSCASSRTRSLPLAPRAPPCGGGGTRPSCCSRDAPTPTARAPCTCPRTSRHLHSWPWTAIPRGSSAGCAVRCPGNRDQRPVRGPRSTRGWRTSTGTPPSSTWTSCPVRTTTWTRTSTFHV